MNKILESKLCAWGAFVIVFLVIVLTFGMRREIAWWAFIDIFFAFMMVFCHLTAIIIKKLNGRASAKLELAAAVCGILTVLSGIGEYIAFQVLFD